MVLCQEPSGNNAAPDPGCPDPEAVACIPVWPRFAPASSALLTYPCLQGSTLDPFHQFVGQLITVIDFILQISLDLLEQICSWVLFEMVFENIIKQN